MTTTTTIKINIIIHEKTVVIVANGNNRALAMLGAAIRGVVGFRSGNSGGGGGGSVGALVRGG